MTETGYSYVQVNHTVIKELQTGNYNVGGTTLHIEDYNPDNQYVLEITLKLKNGN